MSIRDEKIVFKPNPGQGNVIYSFIFYLNKIENKTYSLLYSLLLGVDNFNFLVNKCREYDQSEYRGAS